MGIEVIPLSSLPAIPATEETVAELRAAGIPVPLHVTELGAQGLLALRAGSEPGSGQPSCYGGFYDPRSALCGGCPWSPRCWSVDESYLRHLRSGTMPAPPDVPRDAVEERLKLLASLPPPPRKALPPPPPPPPPRRKP